MKIGREKECKKGRMSYFNRIKLIENLAKELVSIIKVC
jgi:hypothetical protein